MTKVTDNIMKELGFKLDGNRWLHEKGTFIYLNKVPSTLKGLFDISTGTAYKIGFNKAKEL
jgi:hypothetical protein